MTASRPEGAKELSEWTSDIAKAWLDRWGLRWDAEGGAVHMPPGSGSALAECDLALVIEKACAAYSLDQLQTLRGDYKEARDELQRVLGLLMDQDDKVAALEARERALREALTAITEVRATLDDLEDVTKMRSVAMKMQTLARHALAPRPRHE